MYRKHYRDYKIGMPLRNGRSYNGANRRNAQKQIRAFFKRGFGGGYKHTGG